MEMILTVRFRILDPLLEDLLCLFDELSVQIDGVGCDAPVGIVLAEDEVRGLLVVVVHLAAMGFALFGKFFSLGAIATGVGFLGLVIGELISIVGRRFRRWFQGGRSTRWKHELRCEAS